MPALKPQSSEKQNRLAKIQQSTLSKIALLQKSTDESALETSYERFFRIVRTFFATAFKNRYEYTYEEFYADVYAKRFPLALKKNLLSFLKAITEQEYQHSSYTTENLNTLILQFTELVGIVTGNLQAPATAPPQRVSLINTAIESFKKRFEKQLSRRKEPLFDIHRLLLKANQACARKDYVSAKRLYEEIKLRYARLREKEKKQAYSDIVALYKNIPR
jgi:hypothetical protein